jgi:hypothetical protein
LEVCLPVVREALNPLRREAFRQGVSQALLREAVSHPEAASHLAVVRLQDNLASRREAVSHPEAASHLAVVRLQDNLASRREANQDAHRLVSLREVSRGVRLPASSRREAFLQEVSRGVRLPASSRREASLQEASREARRPASSRREASLEVSREARRPASSRREASLEVSREARRPASSRLGGSLEVFQGRVASQDLAGCREAAMTSTSPAGRVRRMSKGWRRSSSTSSARSSG